VATLVSPDSIAFRTGVASVATSEFNLYHNFEIVYAGLATGEGDITGDPLFLDVNFLDFRVSKDSPAIDSARDAGVSFDAFGRSRPQDIPSVGADGTGTTFDRGFYEIALIGPTGLSTLEIVNEILTRTPPTSFMNDPFDVNADSQLGAADVVTNANLASCE
jgi:hypothetical protein